MPNGHPSSSAPLTVRPARRGDRPAAADVLRDALTDDPGWRHVIADRERRRAVLRAVVAAAVADAGDHARVAERDGRIVGVAVWQPPGRYPMTVGRQLRAVPQLLPLVRLRDDGRAAQRLGDALDSVFPAEPVRYLQALGVAPAAQGGGAGSALVAEGLAQADGSGETVYLETGKEQNVAYYEARGFRLVAPGTPVFPGGPVMWRMQRTPGR